MAESKSPLCWLVFGLRQRMGFRCNIRNTGEKTCYIKDWLLRQNMCKLNNEDLDWLQSPVPKTFWTDLSNCVDFSKVPQWISLKVWPASKQFHLSSVFKLFFPTGRNLEEEQKGRRLSRADRSWNPPTAIKARQNHNFFQKQHVISTQLYHRKSR